MTVFRLLLGAAGGVLVAVGVMRFVETGRADMVDAVWWLGGGVVGHDVLLSPLTLLLGLAVVRLLPPWARGGAAAAFVVLGSVTLLAVPVLGRFGASPGNPTLLDRDYWTGWLVFAATVVAAAGGWALAERRRMMRSSA